MTKMELKQEALELPAQDRYELAEALWESLEEEEAQPPLSAEQKRLLDDRIAEDDAQPNAGSPWPEVKERILAGTVPSHSGPLSP